MPEEQKKRGGCLTLWLFFLFTAAVAEVLLGLFSSGEYLPKYPFATKDTHLLLIGVSFMYAISVLAMLNWKKWGFYGYIGVVLIIMALNISIGEAMRAFMGAIGLAVTGALLIERWRYFE